MRKLLFLASICLSGGLLSNCDSNKPAGTTVTTDSAAGGGQTDHAGMSHGGAASNSGMMAAMHMMMQGMDAVKPTGNADHDFARMMLAHHQGAVAMSELQLKEGKDATLRALAETISADQKKELLELESSISRLKGAPGTYKPNNPADPFTSKMKASMSGMMQGMASATGNVDADFAALMVPHHQSAVDMAKAELAHGRDPKLKEMAQQMVTAQEKEIAQLKAWQAKNPSQNPGAAATYECPMGDGGKSNAPGKCAKCGMDLEKKA